MYIQLNLNKEKETTSFINTVGSVDVIDFLPFPFICIRYKL